jgi:hypothetical protein
MTPTKITLILSAGVLTCDVESQESTSKRVFTQKAHGWAKAECIGYAAESLGIADTSIIDFRIESHEHR